ncbi:hypothetical protein [Actinoallomurus sp. NPDC050550]|uniref:hypothetical protein n=1 Tax=Actinoallomurus sp. NPDC050550 TaxID=3154937 RepID=UPI0033C6B19F
MAPKDNGGGDALPSPDLPQVGKGIQTHRDKLHDVWKALQGDLDDLNKHVTKGSLFELQSMDGSTAKGLLTQQDLGEYPAATGVYNTTKTAYNVIGGVYSQFLDSYQAMIDTIKRAAGNYDNTEAANVQSARNAQTTTNNAPTA